MLTLPDYETSYWKEAHTEPTYKPLTDNLEVDVVIVGGGITGLTAAYLLKQAGLSVAVLEKNLIASGTTGGTTGKVTSQHSLLYAELKKLWGDQSTRLYAEAYQTAVEQIGKLIKKEKIDCDWQQEDNYVFTADPKQVQTFKSEAAAAASVGLPATFEAKLSLPFEVAGAVKFTDQAYFHASKYALGLAERVHGQGSYVFERSNVIKFHDGKPARVRTKSATVTAKHVIVATKIPAFPLVARFSYAALEYPHTSYIVAGTFTNELRGMYISPDKGHYSILPVKSGREKLLLIGGENHIPGLGSPRKRHQKLADYAEKYFDISSIQYRWKAMDYMAYDRVPLIGRLYPWSKHLYVATGFKKWGLATSMVAGLILRDLIKGQHNPWAETFDATRLKPIASIPRMIAQNLTS